MCMRPFCDIPATLRDATALTNISFDQSELCVSASCTGKDRWEGREG